MKTRVLPQPARATPWIDEYLADFQFARCVRSCQPPYERYIVITLRAEGDRCCPLIYKRHGGLLGYRP